MRRARRLFALGLALLLCGCQALVTPLDRQLPAAAPAGETTDESATLVQIAACWEAEPLAELLRTGFEARNPAGTVLVTLTDSTQVVALLESDQATLGLVATPVGATPTLSDGWVSYELALDGIALVTSPQLGLANITRQDLAALYGGAVLDWSSLAAGTGELAGEPVVVTRERDAVLRQVFEAEVMEGRAISTAAVVQPHTQATLDFLAMTLGAVAYVPAAQADERVQVVALEDKLPTKSQIERGGYPLRYSLWLVLPVSHDGLADRGALQVATFALSARGSRAIGEVYARP